jgi:CRP/FNR family cyclic AMP-dependent transcriptional regulator
MTPPSALLRRVSLFSDLEERELQQIAGSMKERRFAEGDVIAREGESGVGFFVIAEGEAGVTVRGAGRARLGPGDAFGETALLAESERTATVTALSPMLCYGMTFWDFRPLVEDNPRIAWKLLQTLARRLRDAEQRGPG